MAHLRHKNVKYSYVHNLRYEHDCIRIDEGEYKDVVYSYGSVKFIEEDNQLRIKFDYTVLRNPNNVETESQEFIDIINFILHKNIEIESKK